MYVYILQQKCVLHRGSIALVGAVGVVNAKHEDGRQCTVRLADKPWLKVLLADLL